ncbi:NAD-binding protein [Hymenobacter sp. BT770]|uniref:potassium channel family protein n=1 Tax=Hymenobacter sp. BT770 TaxID=2886942 RepID=UPI001D102B14|nr:potassium channel protein [Hymenobacter sp. BT770]MCC3153056.1 NAD-binding protein [Hymenobacter sp. BT770]MDO3415031.1 NAD-binding protein [Hymenobacter sp. BT770]
MLKQANINRIILAIVLTVSSLVIGIAGFMAIEHFSLVDAFYMTVTTVSTVGYGEVHPLSTAGRIFVSFYILYNLIVVAYLVSVLSTFIFDGELRKLFKMYRTDQEIKRFSGHIIVCGFGRNGRKAFQELRLNGARVVVVEQDEQLMKSLTEGRSGEDYDGDGVAGGKIFTVVGDATNDSILQQAGVERASALITALPKDADNVFVALSARALNPHLKIIARASYKSSESKLISAGADSVVMPDEIGGSHMANLVVRPEVIRFLDLISGLSADKLRLEEMNFSQMREDLHGRSIRELDVRSITGATIIGLRQADGTLLVSPPVGYIPVPGDVLLLLGSEEQIETFEVRFRQL